MSYRGKRRKDAEFIDDSDSGSDGAPQKRAKKAPNKNDGITACELSKYRKVIVKEFKSVLLVDIREYWQKNGDLLPSKKGISLPLDQWEVLRDHIEDVDEAIADLDLA